MIKKKKIIIKKFSVNSWELFLKSLLKKHNINQKIYNHSFLIKEFKKKNISLLKYVKIKKEYKKKKYSKFTDVNVNIWNKSNKLFSYLDINKRKFFYRNFYKLYFFFVNYFFFNYQFKNKLIINKKNKLIINKNTNLIEDFNKVKFILLKLSNKFNDFYDLDSLQNKKMLNIYLCWWKNLKNKSKLLNIINYNKKNYNKKNYNNINLKKKINFFFNFCCMALGLNKILINKKIKDFYDVSSKGKVKFSPIDLFLKKKSKLSFLNTKFRLSKENKYLFINKFKLPKKNKYLFIKQFNYKKFYKFSYKYLFLKYKKMKYDKKIIKVLNENKKFLKKKHFQRLKRDINKSYYYLFKSKMEKLQLKKKLRKKFLNYWNKKNNKKVSLIKNKIFIRNKLHKIKYDSSMKVKNYIDKEKRFFFYQNNLLIKNDNINIEILWRNKIKKTFTRFRLSEYIFLFINDWNNIFFLKNKIYYILTFYKYLILVKKYLFRIKKILIKKKHSYIRIKKFNNFKFLKLLKIEYCLQKLALKKPFLKKPNNVVFRYWNLLKYFNKFFFFIFINIKYNIQKLINKYKSYVYLSYILNVAVSDKGQISLLSMNNFFMKKTNLSFVTSWILHDKIFNYRNILDIGLKENIYWNFYVSIKNLKKKNFKKSFYFMPALKKNLNENFSYFINTQITKNKKDDKIKYFFSQIFNYFLILIYFSFYKTKSFYFCKIKKKFLINLHWFSFINLIVIKEKIINKFLNNFKNIINYFLLSFSLILLIIINKKLKIKKLILKNKLKKKYLFFFNLLLLFNLFSFKFKFNKYFNLSILQNFFNIYSFIKKTIYFKKNFYEFLKKKIYFKNLIKSKNKLKKNYINFLSVNKLYYTKYSKRNIKKEKRGILHLIQKKTNNFLVLSLFKEKRVIKHTSAGQGLNRFYSNSKRQKKGTYVLTRIIFKKLRLCVRRFKLTHVYIKSNFFWNYHVEFLTKYWVLRYKLGVKGVLGAKVGLGVPFHSGLLKQKKKRK